MTIEVGDVVQIIDDRHPWHPSLLIVREVKAWGVTAYIVVPRSNVVQDIGELHIRLELGSYAKVGAAIFVNGEAESLP